MAYPPPQYPSYPPPRRRVPVWLWVLGGSIVGILVIAGGCAALIGTAVFAADREADRKVTVTYELSGSGTVEVNYWENRIEDRSVSSTVLPWSKQVPLSGSLKTGMVSALLDKDGGTVTCRIKKGGTVLEEQTASGAYGRVYCSATAD